MKKPPVTPIFPRNNGSIAPRRSENLPIRNMAPRDHVLRCGGFEGSFNPEIAHNVHNANIHLSSAWNGNQRLLSPSNHVPPMIHCISIAQHIDTCPICSRLYDTDKTLYILAIAGLLILCFLMVKHIIKI
jgi:hypothetical protein